MSATGVTGVSASAAAADRGGLCLSPVGWEGWMFQRHSYWGNPA